MSRHRKNFGKGLGFNEETLYMGVYNCTDIEMLIACGMAMKHFRDNLDELDEQRDDWNVKLADKIDDRINHAWETHMRTDYRADLRKSTDRVMELSEAARKSLHFFKVQVENDFEKDATNEILTNLGFGRFYRKVGKKYQESLSINHSFIPPLHSGRQSFIH